jgi:hypothetical protein
VATQFSQPRHASSLSIHRQRKWQAGVPGRFSVRSSAPSRTAVPGSPVNETNPSPRRMAASVRTRRCPTSTRPEPGPKQRRAKRTRRSSRARYGDTVLPAPSREFFDNLQATEMAGRSTRPLLSPGRPLPAEPLSRITRDETNPSPRPMVASVRTRRWLTSTRPEPGPKTRCAKRIRRSSRARYGDTVLPAPSREFFDNLQPTMI